MWKDPIIEETRNRREEFSEKFGHELDTICDAIQKKRQRTRSYSFLQESPLRKKSRLIVTRLFFGTAHTIEKFFGAAWLKRPSAKAQA